MSLIKHVAKQVRDVYFGGNWTVTNLQETLKDVTWQQATTKIQDLNSIATLVYHINYFVIGVSNVLRGQPLTIKDKYSFNHPLINSEADWLTFKNSVIEDGKAFADLIEQLDDIILLQDFVDPQYGNYYRNLHGIIEHFHYHLGQIVILKKMIKQ